MQRYTILAEFKNNFSSVVYQYVKERLSRMQSQACLSYAEAMVFLGLSKERLAYVIGYPQGAPLHWANTSVRPYGCYYVDMSSYFLFLNYRIILSLLP